MRRRDQLGKSLCGLEAGTALDSLLGDKPRVSAPFKRLYLELQDSKFDTAFSQGKVIGLTAALDNMDSTNGAYWASLQKGHVTKLQLLVTVTEKYQERLGHLLCMNPVMKEIEFYKRERCADILDLILSIREKMLTRGGSGGCALKKHSNEVSKIFLQYGSFIVNLKGTWILEGSMAESLEKAITLNGSALRSLALSTLSLQKESMEPMRQVTFRLEKDNGKLVDLLAKWIARMVTAVPLHSDLKSSPVSLKDIHLEDGHLGQERWAMIIKALDFTTLESLSVAMSDFSAHEQMGLPLRYLNFWDADVA
ncbi:hypothetical protein EDD11_007874 [Mortierella claussenii]|nr:hypothetical protein EDD11_007874 [Mortierella claussenii]